jgi:TolB-like protein
MKIIIVCASCLVLHGVGYAELPDIDSELTSLATKIGTAIKDNGKKKVTVLDFTDLEGHASELGRYIAEQLTVNLVIERKDFSVLDRANLKSILAEHKLTATGLVDPENAKKLGQFAGVDALVLGNIIQKGVKVALTAKIITTDTAEIVGAAKTEFRSDDTIQALVMKPARETKGVGVEDASTPEPKAVAKTYGDLRVELQSLRQVNGNQLLLTFSVANQNPKQIIWLALQTFPGGYGAKARITDSGGVEFAADAREMSGIQPGREFLVYGNGSGFGTMQELQNPHHRFEPAVELKPGDTNTVTMKLYSVNGNRATTRSCTVNMEFLVGHDFVPAAGKVLSVNLVSKFEIN